MAVISILPNGTTSYNPSMGNKNPPKRGTATGWTHSVSKRLRKWLYSVPVDSLTGHGLAFTLTVRDCPETADDWSSIRNSFVKRLFRQNCVRVQWLTEWQARGVPHLHGIAYFENEFWPDKLIRHWLDLTNEKYGSEKWSQDCKPITNVVGWLDYLSKHAARSASHYQRSSENIPEGWSKTGRMWGSRGEWDTRKPMRFEIDQEGFYRYRRIAKGLNHSKVRYRLLQAIKKTKSDLGPDIIPHCMKTFLRSLNRANYRHFRHSRLSLHSSDANLGRMMGTSDWLDQEQSIKIILWLGSQGHDIVQS